MICPSSGSTSPATIRRRVLLPQPDGPSSETNSPAAASHDTSSTATTAPNDFLSRRTVSAGAALLNADDACAGTSVSARDLSPPALGPFRELLRHEFRGREIHRLDERAIGHELRQIGGQLHLLVRRSGELRLREAHLPRR